MYKVIKEFHDLKDSVAVKGGTVYHKYEVGDDYPRQGAKTDDARIAELAGKDNNLGEPLIKEVKTVKKASTKKAKGDE